MISSCFWIALRHALDHVGDQRARQAVQRLVLRLVRRARHDDLVVLHARPRCPRGTCATARPSGPSPSRCARRCVTVTPLGHRDRQSCRFATWLASPYQTRARSSPPVRAWRACAVGHQPLRRAQDRHARGRCARAGSPSTPTYLRRPGVETRLQLADHRLAAGAYLQHARAARCLPVLGLERRGSPG